MSRFWKKVASSKDPSSAKRVLTLVVAGLFILTSVVILFLSAYLIFFIPKGSVNKDILDLLKEILHYDMIIILGGLGMIGTENIGQFMVEKAKIKAKNAIDIIDKSKEVDITDLGEGNQKP